MFIGFMIAASQISWAGVLARCPTTMGTKLIQFNVRKLCLNDSELKLSRRLLAAPKIVLHIRILGGRPAILITRFRVAIKQTVIVGLVVLAIGAAAFFKLKQRKQEIQCPPDVIASMTDKTLQRLQIGIEVTAGV